MAEEEKKVEQKEEAAPAPVKGKKLAGWKRLILILGPFILAGLTIYFMIAAMSAWGPDFTRNHGDTALALCFVFTVLLLIGLVMQWVWPKAITKHVRVVPVGIVFNIILLITAFICSMVAFSVNETRYTEYEKYYGESITEVREGLDYKDNATTKIGGGSTTVKQFITTYDQYLTDYSGSRAVRRTGRSVSSYSDYTSSRFYQDYGYLSFAYVAPKGGEHTTIKSYYINAYDLYLGKDADIEGFCKQYQLPKYEESTSKEDYAPEVNEAAFYGGDLSNYNKDRAIAPKFAYSAYYYSENEKTDNSSSTAKKITYDYTYKYSIVYLLFDVENCAVRSIKMHEEYRVYYTVDLSF